MVVWSSIWRATGQKLLQYGGFRGPLVKNGDYTYDYIQFYRKTSAFCSVNTLLSESDSVLLRNYCIVFYTDIRFRMR